MNPENEMIEAEILRLRSEVAPIGARQRLEERLTKRSAPAQYRKWSLAAATAVTFLLMFLVMVPQSAAARVRSVSHALTAMRSYKIQSFGFESGHRVLYGETLVDGAQRQVSMFDEKGNRLPTSLVDSVLQTAEGHRRRGYLNSKNEKGQTTSKISSAIFEGNKEIGPAIVKGMAFDAPNGKRYIVYTGLNTLEEINDFLSIEDSWTLEKGVVYHGRTLDLLTLKGNSVHVYVDPKNDLPAFVRIQDCEDVYDFGTP